MYIYSELLAELEGYDALLYSVMWRLATNNPNGVTQSNQFLIGRIWEYDEQPLIRSLIRLEAKEYIKITIDDKIGRKIEPKNILVDTQLCILLLWKIQILIHLKKYISHIY
jgi:hypothetical protein